MLRGSNFLCLRRPTSQSVEEDVLTPLSEFQESSRRSDDKIGKVLTVAFSANAGTKFGALDLRRSTFAVAPPMGSMSKASFSLSIETRMFTVDFAPCKLDSHGWRLGSFAVEYFKK